jgi:hypothetical protein
VAKVPKPSNSLFRVKKDKSPFAYKSTFLGVYKIPPANVIWGKNMKRGQIKKIKYR